MAAISEDCTIAEGDSLVLPYEGETWNGRQSGKEDSGTWTDNDSGFADSDSKKVDSYKKTEITIGSGIAIVNKGTICIGGVTGQENIGISGATSGKYCQITMDSNAYIENAGTITCLGYIKEKTLNNKSQVKNTTGTINEPFVIYDYRGGSNTYGTYSNGKVCPFSVYDLPNIQCELIITSTSLLVGYADLYTSETNLYVDTIPAQHNTTDINIIGSSSSLINLSNGAYVICKYTPTNIGYTQSGDGKSGGDNTCLSFYGGATMGSMSMDVKFMNKTITIDTKNVLFPISWKYSIQLNSGTYNLTTKVKFMTGSGLTINKDARLDQTSDVIYYSSFTDTWYGYAQYPTGLDAAKCMVIGTYNISSGSIGGYIETSTSNESKLSISSGVNTSVTSKEGHAERSGVNFPFTETSSITEQASGTLAFNSEGSEKTDKSSLIAGMSYFGKADFWYYNANDFSATITSSKNTYEPNSKKDPTFTFSLQLVFFPKNIRLFNPVEASDWTITSNDQNNCKISSTSLSQLSDSSGYELTVEGKVSEQAKYTLTINVSATSIFGNQVPIDSKTITIDATGSCLLPSTQVLMADMTYKNADDILPGDMVMTYDHETGNVVPSRIILNAEADLPSREYKVLTVTFSDNSSVGIIDDHGFFDLDENRFVYINADNYNDYIGHRFYGYEHNSTRVQITTLESGVVNTENTTICSPVSANNLNIITADKLSISGEIEGLFNIFDYEDQSPKFDSDKMQSDINKYGLMSYENYEDVLTLDMYNQLPCKYMNVAIGKGLITWTQIENYLSMWASQLA